MPSMSFLSVEPMMVDGMVTVLLFLEVEVEWCLELLEHLNPCACQHSSACSVASQVWRSVNALRSRKLTARVNNI